MAKGEKHIFALVIGGSRGLGLATVRKLLEEGIPVIAVHRDRRTLWPEVDAAFSRFTELPAAFHSIRGDAIATAHRNKILETIASILGDEGKIGFLIHSLARGNVKPMVSHGTQPTLTEADLKVTGEAMGTNVFAWVQAMDQMGLFSEDARVIAFTSEGSRRVLAGYGAVAAAKASMEAIIRQIAVEYAPRGIRANCIQAGVTDTDSLRMIPNSEAILKASHKRNPFQRLTSPEDVANAVYLLTRKEAAWITGNIIKVDGGESLS
jgi:enoyl-[acyl-carrier protein] reductase I